MPNIKPESDLRNNNEVINEYEKTLATNKLMIELAMGEKSGKEEGWLRIDEVEKTIGE